MLKINKVNAALIAFAVLFPVFILNLEPVLAKIGVGVGTGKIQVTDKLKPGQIYTLPSVSVLNTGDEEAVYKVSVTYHEKQPEYMPNAEWFSFEPNEFDLKPGEAKSVNIRLNLPIKTVPGDYFAYLEASPNKKSTDGTTSVGIAAAAKLYFTVAPANFVQGVYYRTLSLWNIYEPWSSRVSIGIGAVLLFVVFKKFFNIEINVKGKKEDKQGNGKEN